jgi:hypothetical protein
MKDWLGTVKAESTHLRSFSGCMYVFLVSQALITFCCTLASSLELLWFCTFELPEHGLVNRFFLIPSMDTEADLSSLEVY